MLREYQTLDKKAALIITQRRAWQICLPKVARTQAVADSESAEHQGRPGQSSSPDPACQEEPTNDAGQKQDNENNGRNLARSGVKALDMLHQILETVPVHL